MNTSKTQRMVLSSCLSLLWGLALVVMPAPAQPLNKPASPKPLSREIAKAWANKGITVGWMPMDGSFSLNKQMLPDILPTFQFLFWRSGLLAKLPAPKTPFGLDLYHTKITDAGLKELAPLKNLHYLNLDATKITDAGLKELASLKNLRSLSLHASPLPTSQLKVTEAGLKELAPLKNLQYFYLHEGQVSGKALATLREIGLLHAWYKAKAKDGKRPTSPADVVSLDLSYSGVTEESLKELAFFKNLQKLSLKGTGVTDKGLKELTACKNLRTLYLPVDVTDKTLATLRKTDLLHVWVGAEAKDRKRPTGVEDVYSLHLGLTEVTDAGLKEIAPCKNLEILSLYGAKVTDAGLKELARFKKLKRLSLEDYQVTDKTFATLGDMGLLFALSHAKGRDREKVPTGPADIYSFNLEHTKVKDPELKYLAPFKNLRFLKLPSYQVTDKTLATLREIGLLHALSLATNNKRNAPPPSKAADVDTVSLSFCPVTDAGLKELTPFTNLQTLYLFRCPVTDAGLKELTLFTNLKTLSLSSTNVTGVGLKELAALKNLQTLHLHETKVTDAGLKHLAPLQHLQTLILDGTEVTDAGLKHLASLKNLHTLSVSRTKVTDAGLKHLAALPKLQSLYLPQTKVTEAGVMQLKKALPKCQISR